MNRFFLYALSIIILTLILPGCGSFDLAPITTNDTSTPTVGESTATIDVEATVAAQVSATIAAQLDPAAMSTPTTDSPSPASATPMPMATADVQTFSEAESAQWGHAFCHPTIPICIRPYAIESLGNEQMLRIEIWGSGSRYPVASNRVRWSWRADTDQTQNIFGNQCSGSYIIYPSYQLGFGHLSEICFRLAERPSEIRLEFQAQGMQPVIPFTVGDNLEPVGGWHHFTGSQQLNPGESFLVGAATVTINNIEALEDYLLLHVTIQAPADNRLLVNSPEWIVVGHQLRFSIVDEAGNRLGWHEGKMRNYEPRVGGEIAAGEIEEGYVVLQKAAAEWALLLLYGAPNVTEEDAVMLRLP